MNKFTCIHTFITVIEENSFARAANKLRISTGAVSRQITALEQDLGAQLLNRTTRRLSLTEIGAAYYPQCKKILSELQVAEDEIAGSQKEASGLLSVTVPSYFAEKFILPRLQKFMQANPKLRVKLQVAERFPDLSQEDIDLIFGVSMPGPPELIQKQIMTTRYVMCASPAYLKKYGVPKKPSDLSEHRYITHSMRVPDNILKLDNNVELFVEPCLWLNNAQAMRQCALEDMGIVRLHDYMVNAALNAKKLIEILPQYHCTKIPVFLYYQPSRYLQPKIRKFIDYFNILPTT